MRNFRLSCVILVLCAACAEADHLFYADTKLPNLDGHPANNWGPSCSEDRSHCTQRIVVAVEHGRNHYSNETPKCMVEQSSKDLFSRMTTDSAPEGSTTNAVAIDLLGKVAEVATEKGLIRGDAGKWLAGRSYKNNVGRCVAICAKLPPGATFIGLNSSVFAADAQFRGEWANCPGGHNTDARHCYTPGYSGWDVPMHSSAQGVCGLFKNWSGQRPLWVAVDVRYKPAN